MSDRRRQLPTLPDKYAHREILLKEEAADICRVSVRTIERRIEDGTIPAIYLSERTIRIPASAFPKKK